MSLDGFDRQRKKLNVYCKKSGRGDGGNGKSCYETPRCKYLSKDGSECLALEKTRIYKKPKTLTIVREKNYDKDMVIIVKDREQARKLMKTGVLWAQSADEIYDGQIEEKRNYKRRTARK